MKILSTVQYKWPIKQAFQVLVPCKTEYVHTNVHSNKFITDSCPIVFKQAQYFSFKLQKVWLYFMLVNVTFEWKENYFFLMERQQFNVQEEI